MPAQGRPIWRFAPTTIAWLVAALAFAAPVRSAPPREEPAKAVPSDPWRIDARLNAVSFTDAKHGWVVGDRGAIWNTADGGATWRAQTVPFDGALCAVQFSDEKNGWAAGGWTLPYLHATCGVLLRTRDGGQQWQADPGRSLPAIRGLKAISPTQSIAWGAASSLYPGGAFLSGANGQDWAPLTTEASNGWTAGDFLNAQTGVLAGPGQKVTALSRGTWKNAQTPDAGLRQPRAIQLAADGSGWLVGDGGLIWRTPDGGATWQAPRALPEGVADCDLRAVAVRGAKCWLVGSPGSLVFHSADRGATWQVFSTGQTLPLTAITFIDDRQGWAVGELGVVLATADGGRTWQKQRGGSRVAMLGIFARPEDVPFELFARVSAGEGYYSHVAIAGRTDFDPAARGEPFAPEQLHEALTLLGGRAETAWQFPIRQRALKIPAERVSAAWEAVHQGHARETLETWLVQQIRTWRPELIVTADGDPTAELLVAALPRALEKARARLDPREAALGLSAWTVKKVYAATAAGQGGSFPLAASQFAPRAGKSLAELSWRPRSLIFAQEEPPRETTGFRVLANQLPQEQGQSDLLAGIGTDSSGELRRPAQEAGRDAIEAARRGAQQRRHVQALLEHAAGDRAQLAQWIGNLGELLRDLDDDSAAEMLARLGKCLEQAGQADMAAEVYQVQARRYPRHPLTPATLVWLVQHLSGSEAARRFENNGPGAVRLTSGELPGKGALIPTESSKEVPQPEIKTEGKPAVAPRVGRALNTYREIERHWPGLSSEPSVLFPLAALQRREGDPREADRFLQTLKRSPRDDAWQACAASEQWIATRQGSAPNMLGHVARAAQKPRLDGKLDEEIWQKAKPLALHSPLRDDGDWPGAISLAYDETHLYMAVQCRAAPGVLYPPAEGPPARDADLTRADRIELFLDPDRDHASYYRLSVDYRGWTHESCTSDASWNPKWFVAATLNEGAWTVEAAIPWSELTVNPPDGKQVWCVGAQRTIPGAGFQSWTTPASPDVRPEGFGYLLFD